MASAISRRFVRRALGVSLLVAATASLLSAEQKLLLWEAKGEHGKAYLFGSVHTAKADMYPLNPAIEQAYTSADKLVVEVNMNAVDQQAISAKTMKLGVNFDGTTLADALPPEELEALKKFCTERGLPFAALNIMKPWLAAMTLAIMEYQRQGYDFNLGLDRHFLKQAAESGKEVVQLESADFQLDMLSSFSQELQTKFVIYSIRELDDVTDNVEALMSAWRSGDAGKLEELMLDMGQSNDAELEPIHKAMFTDRNHAMEEKIAAMIEQGGTYFVVVGAGHLISEEGVVSLLRQDGRFKVSQVEAQ
ncbi:MAG: TraB/GumN family protein [Acidobacteria bacterium]|nr:TraB/GumN family protein [Acidobacteriota bacterium]